MAEKWLKTYRTNGTFTFISQGATYRFHVIGRGGHGSNGTQNPSIGGNGGKGGNGSGYAIHEAYLSSGETVEISIEDSQVTLTCQENIITATAGGGNPGSASGANVSNLVGASGQGGRPYNVNTGGNGGQGAASVGKYQASGGVGGRGGSPGQVGGAGSTPLITDTAIGGAGGGGGGGGGSDHQPGTGGSHPAGAGAAGTNGGVVIEIINSSPTIPPYIDAGEKLLADKESTISWGASSDVDGNLTGYALERSVDSGTWTETYRGSSRSITDTISNDWTTVQYRVKAFDAEGDESGYISTAKMTVIHNSPPEAPASIFVPEQIFGGTTATISWSRAADADGNLVGYYLEKSIDGGAWTEAINTTVLSVDIPVAFGCGTIQFRVRAYDSYGAVGGYAVSPIITVINNRAPTISGEDRDLGTLTDSFPPTSFVVSDEDGDNDHVTVTVTLDGAVINSFEAELGKENVIAFSVDDWRKIPNGDHRIEIIAEDHPLGGAEGKRAIRTFTFIKSVRTISFRLANPLLADAMPEKCILSAQGAFPEGCVLRVEVCNNANDAAPAWEEITQKVLTGQKHFFNNNTKTAEAWGVGVRVSLERGTATGDCYIHSLRGNYA